MQVVHVDLVLDRLEAELVGRAVGHAALHAAAGQPHREAVRVVVAARLALALAERHPAELAAPDDQRRCRAGRAARRSVEQRRDRLIDLGGVLAVVLLDALRARPRCLRGVRRRSRAARTARRARPAGGRSGSCGRTRRSASCRRRTASSVFGVSLREVDRLRAPRPACGRRVRSWRSAAASSWPPGRASRCSWFSFASRSSCSRWASRVDVGRAAEVEDRVAGRAEQRALSTPPT